MDTKIEKTKPIVGPAAPLPSAEVPATLAGIAAALQRNDYRTVLNIVEPGSRVLDLGCGNGNLLYLLRDLKNVTGYGVELQPDLIMECIEKGLSVFHGNLDEGLRDFDDQSFDYVILNQTLQVVHRPSYVIEEMLRVGKKCIVSFPNFAYWRVRLRLLITGRMPVDEIIPHEWYNTPNIHHLTVSDFHLFCRRLQAEILESHYFQSLEGRRPGKWAFSPNWSAGHALFVITRTQGP